MTRNDLLKRLGIEHPIIQAPMAGGPTTPELVAAVSNAGGLGSLGAAYLTPSQITEAIRQIRLLTDQPFNVNLFAGGYEARPHADAGPMLAVLAEVHEELGLPPPVLAEPAIDPFPEQFEAVLQARPAVFSFTFGMPDAYAMTRLKKSGMAALGTATTVEEVYRLVEAGVDGIVAQGAEAGGHRGTFGAAFETSMVPVLDLVAGIVAALPVPVIGSGGLMDGRDITAAMKRGASAVQLGTAFLTCPESGASAAYKRALLDARTDTTVVTRVFSGRPARGLRNAFIVRLEGKEDVILPYPLQNALTRPMRTAAARKGDSGFLSLWAGQGVARVRVLPAAELVRHLVEEMKEASR
jgi:nitronate monooxygenase